MADEVLRVVGGFSRSAPGAVAGAASGRALHNLASRSREFFGDGRIEGKISIEGTPAARKVRLFEGRTALLVAETWSHQDGHYRFDFLDSSRDYFILAHDHVRQFNAVIADGVKPEPTVYP